MTFPTGEGEGGVYFIRQLIETRELNQPARKHWNRNFAASASHIKTIHPAFESPHVVGVSVAFVTIIPFHHLVGDGAVEHPAIGKAFVDYQVSAVVDVVATGWVIGYVGIIGRITRWARL